MEEKRMVKRFLGLKTTLLIFSVLLSVILLSPVLVADDGANETTRLWGRVVDSVTDRPLKGATISIKNLQTGNTITLTQEEGQYRLDDTTGYFSLTASCEGYFDSGDGHNETMILKGDIKKVVLKLDEIEMERKICGNVSYYNGTGNASLNSTQISLYCTEGVFEGYEDSVVNNETGYYEFDVFPSTFTLTVKEEGYITQVAKVTVNATHDVELDFNMSEGNVTFEIFGFAEDAVTGENIDGIMVTVCDVNNSREFTTSSNTSYFYLEVYPSTFDIIVDAGKYQPAVQTSIVIDEDNPMETLYTELDKDDMEENLTVEVIVLDDDFTKLKVVRNWCLNSDSVVPGFDSGAGNLKMKIDSDERFGNGDGTLSVAEVAAFKAWYEKIGPEFLYTDGFFKVNDTAYSPEFINNNTELNYDVNLSKFAGKVDNLTDMKIKTTMEYVNDDEDVTDPDNTAYKVWLGNIGSEYTVAFDNTYEIITEENDDWGFALDDNGDAIRYKARIFNATTLEIFEKIAPEGNVTITVNGIIYYPGDEIYVGSASDDVVMNNDFENITFDASGSSDKVGEIANYTWSFGDGNKGYGKIVTHNYSVAAELNPTYKVTLTLKDSANDNEMINVNIIVDTKSPNLPVNSLLVDTLVTKRNQTDLIEFNATKSTDTDSGIPDSAGNYMWEFADGAEEFGKTVKKSFAEAGETKINLTVKDAVGNSKRTSFTIEILDTMPPVVEILGPLSAEVNAELNLSASACYDNVDKLEDLILDWDFGDDYANTNSIIAGNNTTVKYNKPGTYVVTLNVTDKSNNTASAQKTISITAPDLVVLSVDVSDSNPQKGEKIDIGALIKNQGGVAAMKFDVTLLVNGKVKESIEIAELTPGEETSVNFTWKAGSKGDYNITVYADHDEIRSETVETNNWDEILVSADDSTNYIPLIIVIVLIVIAIAVFIFMKKKKGL